MRKLLLATIALGALATAIAPAADAMPLVGGKAVAEAAPTNVDHVYWRRVCGPIHCRWVWIHRHHRWW